MKLELKNVKIHEDMSEETTCFSATLYVNGVKAAICSNRGCGGPTDVNFLSKYAKMIDVMRFCNENPIYYWYKDKRYEMKGVDSHVDELLEKYRMEKYLAKMQKNNLCLYLKSSKDAEYVVHATLNMKQPISELLGKESGRMSLKSAIERMKGKGYVIMNKNIDFKQLGL